MIDDMRMDLLVKEEKFSILPSSMFTLDKERGMGLRALVVARENFENERGWGVDIFCTLIVSA